MKEAMYYSKLKNKIVQCNLCPKKCVVKEGDYGNCNARRNIEGTLYSVVYARPVAIAIDPIEKKPFYNFMKGEPVFSIGTTGCNLHCKFCQNYTTSQVKSEEVDVINVKPEKIIQETIKSRCKIIAYTYNEPIIFYEYMLDIAKLAKKKGIKNVIVSNGFINQEPLKELLKYIDAANIDLKSFDTNFYKKHCDAWLEPVLETLKTIAKSKTHLEITNLVIDRLNDDTDKIDGVCKWIKNNLGNDIPLHFSAAYPCYKMMDVISTPKETLLKAKKIAEKNKLKYVYLGNI